jgi:hypothetical protein
MDVTGDALHPHAARSRTHPRRPHDGRTCSPEADDAALGGMARELGARARRSARQVQRRSSPLGIELGVALYGVGGRKHLDVDPAGA